MKIGKIRKKIDLRKSALNCFPPKKISFAIKTVKLSRYNEKLG